MRGRGEAALDLLERHHRQAGAVGKGGVGAIQPLAVDAKAATSNDLSRVMWW
ncbi:MAG: hypothetical protein HC829_08125 [Bacteroidales bacterium]|nr:hypothetical protein [Bacteroidales bacterium]